MIKLFEALSKRPVWVLGVILGLSALFLFSMGTKARLVTNMDEYMPADNPEFVYNDEVEELFGLRSSILLAIESETSIYNPETLKKLQAMVQDLPESLPEISADGITSLATAENITALDGGLEVQGFFDGGLETTDDLSELRRQVESNNMVHGRMVSKDGKSTLIVAELKEGTFNQDLYTRLQKFAKKYEGPETIRIAGRPVVEGELARLGPQDMMRMAPLVVLFMALILFLLLRSARDTALSLFIVFVGTLTAFGAKTLLGIPIYSVDTMMPVMLIAIGVAYGIHMHNAVHHLAVKNPQMSRQEMVHEVLKAMILPVFMTALTTAVGFASLVSSSVLPVRYFGLFIALGVMVEMVLALILFPGALYLWGPPKKKARETSNEFPEAEKPGRISQGLAKFLERHGISLTLGTLVLVGLSIWGTSLVWIDTSFLANFQKDNPVAQTDKFVNENFGGTSTLYLVLDSTAPETFKDPQVLKLMDRIQKDLLTLPKVGDSFGLPDFIRRMHRVMNTDTPEWEVIPDSQDLIAQYLLLYEMSGDPEKLNRVVDYDYARANLTFQLKSDSSALISKILDAMKPYDKELKSLGLEVHYAGTGYKSYIFSKLLLEGQIGSLLGSFVIVILLLSFMFRSFLWGLVGTLPIAITALVNFGVMGLLGIPLSSATALISSIAVGIGVDYAIHLMEYYRARRAQGDSVDLAAKETVAHTGRAILFNALTVMGGFGVLLFSVFPPNQQVGGLIALNMFVSALATMTVLLFVIVYMDKKKEVSK